MRTTNHPARTHAHPRRPYPRTVSGRRGLVGAVVGSAALVLLAGCASPGHPQPPSLNIPRLATDLTVERVGDAVQLHWITPDRTTDGARLAAAPLVARVCREPAAAASNTATRQPASGTASRTRTPQPGNGASAPCVSVAEIPVHPGPSSATDPLPAALTTGAPRLLAYRIELLGPKSRSAGPSAPAFTLAGAAPQPLAGFTASDTANGALLRWQPGATPPAGESIHLDRTALNPPTAPAAPAAQPGPASHASPAAPVHLTAGEGDSGGVLDRSGEIGQTYTYTAQRVRTVSLAGRSVELRGPIAGPVTVTLRNTFPPSTPAGLAASPGPGSIDLSWEPVEEPLKGERLAGYHVYRQLPTADTWTLLTPEPTTTPAFRDMNVQPGVTYRYRVTALDTAGNESAPTPDISETAAQP